MGKGAQLAWGISQSWVNWHFLKTMRCCVLILYMWGEGTAGMTLPTGLADQAGVETGLLAWALSSVVLGAVPPWGSLAPPQAPSSYVPTLSPAPRQAPGSSPGSQEDVAQGGLSAG